MTLLFFFVALTQPLQSPLVVSEADQSGCKLVFSQKPELKKKGQAYALFLPLGNSPQNPGEPDLQSKEFWVGIPQTGSISLTVEPAEFECVSNIDIAPVPKRSFEEDIFEKDEAIYGKDEFYPQSLATVVSIGQLRDLRVARIRISPAQYNPREKTLRVYSRLSVRINFSHKPVIRQTQNSPFERIYSTTIVNYPVCKDWRVALAPPLPNPFAISKDWIKIQVRDEGVYKITSAALQRLGYNPANINPKTFRLFNIGEYTPNEYYPESTLTEIPLYIYGDGDGKFDKGDYILFYARPTSFWDFSQSRFITNPFTDYNYFWLTWGNGTGLRIQAKPAGSQLTNPIPTNRIQTTIHLERDSLNTAWGGLLWTWLALDGTSFRRAEIEATFPNGDSLINLTGVFYTRTLANNLKLYLNSELLTTITFTRTVGDPYRPVPDTVTIPVNRRLTKEKNTFTFEIVGKDTSTTFLDFLDAEYRERLSLKEHNVKFYLDTASAGYEVAVGDVRSSPLVLDLANPFKPEFIVVNSLAHDSVRFSTKGGLFYITDLTKVLEPSKLERRTPGSLRTQEKVDYYIVVPDEFYDVGLFIERLRQGKAGKVKTVKLSEIYDDFGFGMEEPGPLKEFFKEKKPHYALLAADGSYDYKNNLHRAVPPMIPPYERGGGLEPSVYNTMVAGYDSWYGDFTGDGSTPDMAISRITARSPKELRQFVDKVIAYETSSFGPWARRFILAGDDVKGTQNDEAEHITNCESVGGLVKVLFNLVKVYLTEYPYEGSIKPQAKAALIKELNRGGVGFAFFGHGNGHQLAHEQAFLITDVPQIQNGRRLPFCFFGSCGVGRFEDTNYECIAEELVRSPSGAIGAFAATKGSFGSANLSAALALFTALLDSATLGDAFIAAMLGGRNYTYELFGEPATKLHLPKPEGTIAISPARLPLGGPVQVQAAVPVGEAEYSLVGYGLEFLREYTWFDGEKFQRLSYYLPGQEFYRGVGKKPRDSISTQCFVPLDLPRTALTVSDGKYTPQPNTARIDFYLWTKDRAVILRKDSLGIDTTFTPAPDGTGPQITLYANGKPIMDNDYLPRSFTLTGECSDPSGIRLVEISGKDPFGFYINKPGWVTLADKFTYDPGSWTKGRFSYPVTLPAVEDTIVANAYDNLSNRTVLKLIVKTTPTERLAIEKPLVYPNPAQRDAYFTFYLTKDAFASLRIYTLTGRLVKTIPDFPCEAGYNQIYWNGRDEDGSPLANGVYFYKLYAHTESFSSDLRSDESAVVIDKFIVLK